MKQWKIILTIMLCIIPISNAYTQIQYSQDNVTWQNAINITENQTTLEVLNNGINCETNYNLRFRQVWATGNSSWSYTSVTTDACGVDQVPIAAVLLFGIGGFFIHRILYSKSRIIAAFALFFLTLTSIPIFMNTNYEMISWVIIGFGLVNIVVQFAFPEPKGAKPLS